MVIRSIEIENFLSYYKRQNNVFKFDVGPTIIIGQNNTGKSKLFDAFNWVFYDRAFDTKEEKWEVTSKWKEKIVNNLSRKECKVGESVTCSVTVAFDDETDNKYLLTRTFNIRKSGETTFDCPKFSELLLTKTERLTNNKKDYFDKDAVDIIRLIFPENLSKYFLFQGENISQIMSLNKRSDFTNALNDLSRIEVFEIAKSKTEKVLRSLKKEFEEKEDADKVLQQKKVELSKEIDRLKEEVANYDEQFENYCKERDQAKAVFEKKSDELKKYEECAQILREIEFLERQKEGKNELRSSLIENQKKEIFDKWMYAGTQSILKEFLRFYDKNKIEKKIPEPIRQEFIREMLSEKVCKVCGTHAPEDSAQFKKISTFINDKALDKEIELISQLGMVADNMLSKAGNIKQEIAEFYERSGKIEDDIENLQVKIKSKEEEFRNVIPSGISEDEVKSKNYSQLQKDRDNAKNDWENYESKINGIKVRKEHSLTQLELRQKEYDSLIESSSNAKERERLLLAEKINVSTNKFYNHFLSKLISDIETEANDFFAKMTKLNPALSGRVKVDYENKEVYAIDENGIKLYNINQANKVSLQISFVAAVLSVSNKFWNTFFPFIADAPISALGGNNKLTSIETMTDIFSQSIIILKDDAVTSDTDSIRNDVVRHLVRSNEKVRNAYELSIEGSESVEEQRTRIQKIK